MAITFPLSLNHLIIDYRARDWCLLPYPDHPHGCPNFNHNPACPPQVCRIEKFVDLSRDLWLVVERFDLAAYVAKMKALHPDWSDRQVGCVLYWQGGVKHKLTVACQRFIADRSGMAYTLCPEAMGMQVIRTAQELGIPIKARPDRTGIVFKVALVGYR